MIIYTHNHTYKYESEKLCRIYFPTEKIIFASDGENPSPDPRSVYTSVEEDTEKVVFLCRAEIDGQTAEAREIYEKGPDESSALRKGFLGRTVTAALTEITGIIPPWGVLTGVRPAKLMRKYINEKGKEKAEDIFTSFLKVSSEKTALAASVARYENDCIARSGKKSFSLYVSIPFCPTRCSYCSFVSHSIVKAKGLIPDYIGCLCKEIKITSDIARELGLYAETVYIGGGTPTSFSARELETILRALSESFDMSNVKEFTVEAGRPDTIDEEKLRILKKAGVSRISINPQSFSDEVLRNIGRPHTALDTLDKYFSARFLGFDNINMDLIAGLPGDTLSGFKYSIDRACSLSPENITVHALALKRSSSLAAVENVPSGNPNAAEMVDYSIKTLTKNGYAPYYMYRQSKSAGNLENVGWCTGNLPCLYNIYMMEEIHTVLAVGGAAVTKLVSPADGHIERIFNFKYPYEYINRFGELIERKNIIRGFYSAL